MSIKERSHLHNIKVQSEAACTNEVAANHPENPTRLIDEGGYPKQQAFNV